MVGERANERVGGTRFGDVRWVEETGSTNDDLMRVAADGAPEGIVLAADHQTAGRGRLGRNWTAPAESSLLVSVLLRPPAAVAASVAMAASVALVDAISAVTGLTVRVKWPNDLVWPGDGSADDRKLAGLLAEANWPAPSDITAGWQPPPPDERVVVVVGSGVNVNWPSAMPAELAETATALNQLVGRPVDRLDLLVEYLLRLDDIYGELVDRRDAAVVAGPWRAGLATLGRLVRVDLGTEQVKGRAVDVTDDGRLVVETAAGERRVFATGDVVHVRPVG
ncbi:MAG: biotin--[acetyl-CoA-carboxylase] ligase [Acidimicrobiales bacterium]